MGDTGVSWGRRVSILLAWCISVTLPVLASGTSVAAEHSKALGGELVYLNWGPPPAVPEVYGIRTSGSQPIQLPLPTYASGTTGFSPDGKQVATAGSASEDGSVLGKLLIADTNGRHKRTLWKYQGGGSAPAWNPAGTEIAVTLVPNTSRDGSLYPDAVKGGLWIVPVKGGRHHLIAPAAQGSVAWSPNGGSLVYTTGLPTGAVRIRTISAKGGPYRQIATISPDSQNDSVNVSVAWSPNGKNILIDSYQQLLGGNYGVGHSKVQQVPSTGGALQTLLPNNPLAFYMGAMYSPDGKKIAMVTVSVAPPGSTTTIPYIQYWTLNTLNVNGSDLQTITGLSNHAQLLGWVKAFKS